MQKVEIFLYLYPDWTDLFCLQELLAATVVLSGMCFDAARRRPRPFAILKALFGGFFSEEKILGGELYRLRVLVKSSRALIQIKAKLATKIKFDVSCPKGQDFHINPTHSTDNESENWVY